MPRPDPAPRWPAYLRIPPFVPVPMRSRRDGWTPERQGAFIGWLVETGSVVEAAARVGCSRESVYRLRRREGALGFVAAWDFAASADEALAPARKFTPEERVAAAFDGAVHVVMRRGRYVRATLEVSNSALVALMRQYLRAGARWRRGLG